MTGLVGTAFYWDAAVNALGHAPPPKGSLYPVDPGAGAGAGATRPVFGDHDLADICDYNTGNHGSCSG